jgi:hypothetical protein
MEEQKWVKDIDTCVDKVMVLKELFHLKRDDDQLSSFYMGLEKICDEVTTTLMDVTEAMTDIEEAA